MEGQKEICGHSCSCKSGNECDGDRAMNLVDLHDSPRSFKEDYPHENGQYINQCMECGSQFMGHKRRCWCKMCQHSLG